MSKKTANFRHFDEWSEQCKKFGEDVELTGVYFKHRRPMFVQRMTGYVKLNFTSTLPDGTEFTSTAKEFASWNAEGQCTIKKKRCTMYDLFSQMN